MVFSVFRPPKPDARAAPTRRSLFRSSSSTSSTRSLPSRSPSSELATIISSTNHPFADGSRATPDLTKLNDALAALTAIFPDVRPEVFREMLSTFSGESRLHIVAEQLLRHKAKWVKGRWRVPTKDSSANMLKEIFEVERAPDENDDGRSPTLLPIEETFRSESYKRAVRDSLYQELKVLSRSTIDGVLAEQNYSYTLSRPILLGLATKSWRNSFTSFISKWKKPSHEISDKHYMLIWNKPSNAGPVSIPTLRETGNEELDAELYSTVLTPLLEQQSKAQEAINVELASLLNEKEAEEAHALYECECCFSDTTFERMATCSTGAHTICFNCIEHAVSEALYGQSWGLNVDHNRGQIACLAPTDSPCEGCIPHHLAKRAVTSQSKGGIQTWQKFESRVADEALFKSQAPFVRCPFCPYAEVDALHLPPSLPRWRINTNQPIRLLLLFLVLFSLLPLITLYTILSKIVRLSSPRTLLANSLTTLTRRTHLSTRFHCLSPTCLRTSCLLCHKPWRDPHICYESATLSLRTTIEAARTAALKRTCPRCGLGFVKDSGCNKMVCVCGYAMCYICRQGLGRKTSAPGGQLLGLADMLGGGEAAYEEGEGYRHFCQHFRPAGGRCTECDRCDLYRGENEDEIVKRAGEKAEKEWREREGVGEEVVSVPGGRTRWWTLQEAVDWWVAGVLKC